MIKKECGQCVCVECFKRFKIEPIKCEYSDCKWCKDEKGYVEKCNKYIEKGGTYGR